MDEKDPTNMNERITVDSFQLAEMRTSLATSRTYLAAERTFAAWIRTGFAISGVGITLGTALKDTQSRWISWTMAISLVSVGIFTFIYAWHQYKNLYHYINTQFKNHNLISQSYSFNYYALTIVTVILVLSSLLGFFLMFY